ncbi:nuclear pore complex protein An-Nup82 [Apiospora saccharicola]|uniref:Nuclear pore complex protein An-Nup82 n=1 Tax=Apiospora saccharicola TaxID=335842 RepID=A0ABR1WG82_9PEZI
MPKVKAYTPAWLSRPSPGHRVFAPVAGEPRPSTYSSSRSDISKIGPRRTIAQSGSQVYVAVGKEIRWVDLIELKEKWQEKDVRGRTDFRIKREYSNGLDTNELLDAAEKEDYVGFRTLTVNVAAEIRQLVISPHEDYLAVLTTHTVRIIAVPDLSHLTSPTNEIIKPKSWTLGPTTHVFDRSAVASALWHPLGVNGSALVTVTTDAVVRVWELSPSDRWSFDKSTLTIDLKKLADGTSLDQNFAPSNDASGRNFSADSFEMDVASAAFAGRGSGGVGIVGNLAAIEDDPDVSPAAKLLAQQQLDWMSDLDTQEPVEVDGPLGEPPAEVYSRPSRPGVVPKLQGPFDLELSVDAEDDMDIELTDIFVIGQKLDTDELMMGEEDELEVDDIDQEGLSLNVVCLLSSSGQLRICLDLDGVQAKWLPPKNRVREITRSSEDEDECSLLTFQTLDTLKSMEMITDGWPMFSPDVTSRYAFYVTHPTSITYLSLSPWVFRLESELRGESQSGLDFRMDVLVRGQTSTRERLYTSPNQGDDYLPLAAAVAIRDPDLGYFILSATPFESIAVVFETPDDEFETKIRSVSPIVHQEVDVKPLDFYEPRPTFQPSHIFERNSALPELLEKLRTSRHKAIVNHEVRLSPVTLQVFTDVHQLLSEETHGLGAATSELFRRLESLQHELRQQITKAHEVKARVEAITGEDQAGDVASESSKASVERRLEAAKQRSGELNRRLEKMRKTVSKGTTRELSDKERAWVNEMNALDASLYGSDAPTADGPARLKHLGKRYDEAKALRDDLVPKAEKIAKPDGDREDGSAASTPDLRIPSELRKAKLKQVQGLLERESALVDAVKSRLEKIATKMQAERVWATHGDQPRKRGSLDPAMGTQ